jgi:DNA-binding MarR family transcriptional regulator
MQPLSWQGSLSLLISSTRRKLKRLYVSRLAEHGLTPAQMSALLCLEEGGEQCLGALAGSAHIDAPTASRVVTRLVATGRVRMNEDAQDRRRAKIALTPSGRALAKRLRPLTVQVEEELRDGMSDQEVRVLMGGLQRVSENISRRVR